ncbi:MAG: hypothetical protein WEK74_04270 [Hydrogenophaga sp.]
MLQRLQDRISTATLAVVAGAALVLNLAATAWLNASYAASGFPVPYHEAQLSFDAQKIKGWYAFLIDNDTLGVYWQTQFIDFAFIATVLVLHVSVLWLVSRLFAPGTRGRSVMLGVAALSAIAPLADAAENLVSFVMLADPSGFPDALALVYSSLAAVKFAFFTLAYVALPLGVLVGLWQRWSGKRAVAH